MIHMTDKGCLLHQGIVIGEIERSSIKGSSYIFTYDPWFDECFQIDNLPISDAPYLLNQLPGIMYAHLDRIDDNLLAQVKYAYKTWDDLSLWLACCVEGIIFEDSGCRMI